ncbi:hypothetical protein L6452_15708 [Arctium lappa]|uniref:Uncharacterized protein n=1 Tax=Arctium lappa TaxID=4217 RepID=A0ACB9CPF8_ARCLA|nr:hypothetical protein L6452_15708 [Arctium lappa]
MEHGSGCNHLPDWCSCNDLSSHFPIPNDRPTSCQNRHRFWCHDSSGLHHGDFSGDLSRFIRIFSRNIHKSRVYSGSMKTNKIPEEAEERLLEIVVSIKAGLGNGERVAGTAKSNPIGPANASDGNQHPMFPKDNRNRRNRLL